MIKLDISHLFWQLNKSFNISRGSKNTAETIEVKLTDNKFTGIGECVPYGRYAETLESVQKEILELKDGMKILIINRENLDQFINNGDARNAVDCALWD
jgi:L-alanine-DL-glutamate epimerase and related enzymes of enolase superfamily